MGARHRRRVVLTPIYYVFTVVFYSVIVREVSGRRDCPVSSGSILYAYPDAGTLKLKYEYNPIRTDIKLLDDLLNKVIDDDDVECRWEVRAKEGHHAEVSFSVFGLQTGEGSQQGDCVKIYDGQDDDGTLLAELCGNASPANKYDASDRSLFIVYTQGTKPGHRYFDLVYKATPRSKEYIIKIAGIASGVVAAIVICFLVYKFSHSCRPCRKRCCADQTTNHTVNQRELRPLAPQNFVPPSVADGRGDNFRNDGSSMQQTVLDNSSRGRSELNGAGRNGAHTGGGAGNVTPGPISLPGPNEGIDDEEIQSPGPDEPPPSYDSIFGDEENVQRK